MSQPDSALVGRARQGDVQAIATLFNQRTQPKGVTTKVAIKGDCLQLLLASQDAPPQQTTTTFVRSTLTKLKISGVHRVKLYGQKQGDDFPAWNTEFEIVEPDSSQTSPHAETSTTPITIPKPIQTNAIVNKQKSLLGDSFRISSAVPKTSEQQKISKSMAYEYGIGGAILGLLFSLPSVWAALKMFQIEGGGDFVMIYVIGIGVVVLVGYLSGFGQGLTQFGIACSQCSHKFVLPVSGGNCPACSTGLYIDGLGDCQVKKV
ncbi:hypothetical protein [Phormidesmis priestleyi]|uniref:hypothetical protein n=1 Tax=Phormidesmis priestleyi TaxID=268141 RepID=UPI00083B3200|nr:hypothetical protein [Phormidesmis priestleyi]